MPATAETQDTVQALAAQKYKYGFTTDIAMDAFPKGLNEDIVRLISAKKREPEWMLEWRLKAYALWRGMAAPLRGTRAAAEAPVPLLSMFKQALPLARR